MRINDVYICILGLNDATINLKEQQLPYASSLPSPSSSSSSRTKRQRNITPCITHLNLTSPWTHSILPRNTRTLLIPALLLNLLASKWVAEHIGQVIPHVCPIQIIRKVRLRLPRVQSIWLKRDLEGFSARHWVLDEGLRVGSAAGCEGPGAGDGGAY